MTSAAHPQPQKIHALLLDFGGVVAEEGFRDGLRELARRHHLDPDAVVHAGAEAVYDSGYVIGRGTELDFWKLMEKRTGLPPYDPSFTEEILCRFIVRPPVVEAVRRVRSQGLPVAILSDQTDWLDRLDARDHFSRDFDRVFNSYHLGKGKRDPTLFPEVVESLGVAPAVSLFVDDTPGNVERARGQGLQGVLFSGQSSLIETLAGLNAPAP